MRQRTVDGLRVAACALFLCVAASAAQAQDITTGLVGHWTLDDAASSSTAVESVGGYNGTEVGSVTFNPAGGRINGSASFPDAAGNYLVFPNNAAIKPAAPLTISVWHKPDASMASQRLVQTEDWNERGAVRSGATLDVNPSQIILSYGDGAGSGTSNRRTKYASFSFVPNEWHHIVGIIRGQTDMDIYVNGVNLTGTYDGLSAATGPVYTGSYGGAIGGVLAGMAADGGIDDVRIYSRALTAADVAELYALRPGRLRYNADYRTPEYFDGGQWIGMGIQQYVANAVSFNGTSDYLEKSTALTGVVDGNKGTISFWFKLDVASGNMQVLRNSSSRISIEFSTNNGGEIRIWGETAANVNLLDLGTVSLNGDTSGWHHVMASWDLSDPAKRHVYLDGVADMDTGSWTVHVDGAIEYSAAYYRIGFNAIGVEMWDGALADLWFDINNYVDLSVEANRRKFISADGAPVDLGANGSVPTGSAPDIFLSGATASWHTNKGTGGGFTEYGALTDAAGPNSSVCVIDNGSMSLVDSYNVLADTQDNFEIAVQGNYAYVVSRTLNSLTIYDVSDPANIVKRDSHVDATKLAIARGVAVQGNYAYVTGFTYDGVTVYDISDPDNIVETGTITSGLMNGAFDIQVSGNYAYVTAAQSNRLTIVDISNPNSPALMDDYSSINMNNPTAVHVEGNYAYVVAGNATSFSILDISNPASIVGKDYVVDAVKLLNGGKIFVHGNYAYVTGISYQGLIIYDISDPDNIIERGVLTGLPNGSGIDVAGDYALVSGSSFWAINVSDPTNPVLAGTFTNASANRFVNMVRVGQYVYGVSESVDNFAVVNVGCDPLSGTCANPDGSGGEIVYNGTSNVMQYCDGEDWRALGPVPGTGGGGCSNPARGAGSMVYNGDGAIMQYCDGAAWVAVGKEPAALAPTGCPNVGDTCSDGTRYAGLSPDGNAPMYAAAADEGTFTWGSSGTARGTTSQDTGESNTATLAAFGAAAHPAAYACENSTAQGYTDWYLPANNELFSVLWNIGLFTNHWSSSEATSTTARYNWGSAGSTLGKGGNVAVRCIRKHP